MEHWAKLLDLVLIIDSQALLQLWAEKRLEWQLISVNL